MATQNYNLPTIAGNMSADVVRDMNALAEATDDAINQSVGEVNNRLTTHLDDLVKHGVYGGATGTNTLAMTVTVGASITSYPTGMLVAFKNTTANTGAVTLNVNGLGAKSVRKANGSTLAAGNLKAGGVYQVRYDGTNFFLLGEGGEYGNVTPADVVLGKIFGMENGLMTGTATVQSLGGKRWASGMIPSKNPRIVSGLTFTPRTILTSSGVHSYGAGYSAEEGGINALVINNAYFTIVTSGFMIEAGSEALTHNTKWIAIE